MPEEFDAETARKVRRLLESVAQRCEAYNTNSSYYKAMCLAARWIREAKPE